MAYVNKCYNVIKIAVLFFLIQKSFVIRPLTLELFGVF